MLGKEKDILKEIRREMETGSKEEVVVKAIKELMKSLTKSVKSAEWSLDNGILYYRGKVYIPNSDLRRHISTLCHDSKIAGHAGRWKTLETIGGPRCQDILVITSPLATCVCVPKRVANLHSENFIRSLSPTRLGTLSVLTL